jgi:hypothetical protein
MTHWQIRTLTDECWWTDVGGWTSVDKHMWTDVRGWTYVDRRPWTTTRQPRHCRSLHVHELYNNGGWQRNGHGTIECPWALQQWQMANGDVMTTVLQSVCELYNDGWRWQDGHSIAQHSKTSMSFTMMVNGDVMAIALQSIHELQQ